MTAVLVVEDDRLIGSSVTSALRAQRLDVVWSLTGAGAMEAAVAQAFDLVLLDLGLPDADGVDVCRRLRAVQPGCVIVILTARVEEIDVVVGLEAGADDYLTKPFRVVELLARVRAHLRRGTAAATVSAPLRVGPLTVDLAARRVWVGPQEVALRAKEFDLLARLAAEPGVAVSRESLMSDVWDEHWFGSTKTLDVHVAALRRRLDAVDAEREDRTTPMPTVVTVRGHGYRLQPDG